MSCTLKYVFTTNYKQHIVPEMTHYVSSGTLNPTHSLQTFGIITLVTELTMALQPPALMA